jgi:hypothetical protein
MQFMECVDGRYRIYAAALAAPSGRPGFVATLVIKRKSKDRVEEPEAFRDVALTDDFVWSNEGEALRCAVRLAHDIIRNEPHRLAGQGLALDRQRRSIRC